MAHDIDHAVVAGADLPALERAFEAAGFAPEYGGAHGNGVTHQSQVALPDGSYVELISTRDRDRESPWWDAQIRSNAGPTAWALDVADIETETDRLAAAGIAVDGPTRYARERPDGTRVEWDLTVVGDGFGTTLPFLISDRTPRGFRVADATAGKEAALAGVAEVVLAVPDLAAGVERFRTAFDAGTPDYRTDSEFGGDLARFPSFPAALAEPADEGWLADRLDAVGPSPCAVLFRSAAPETTATALDTEPPESWFGDSVRWLDVDAPGRLGVLG